MGAGKTLDTMIIMQMMRYLEPIKGDYVTLVTKSAVDKRNPPNILRVGNFVLDNVISVEHSDELYELREKARRKSKEKYGTEMVAMSTSELQFFDEGIIDFLESLGKNDYFEWDGLYENFRGETFTFANSRRNMIPASSMLAS